MKRLIISFVISILLISAFVNTSYAGENVWKSGYNTTNGVTVITGAWIYKYYSATYKKWRFVVKDTFTRFHTSDGKSISASFYGRLMWVNNSGFWQTTWTGPTKSASGSNINWVYTGTPNLTYNQYEYIMPKTLYTINGWTTEARRLIFLKSNLANDPWY